jgi:hypothetical protein
LFFFPFDLDRMEARGTPKPLLQHVFYSATFGFAQFDFSKNGTLAYRRGVGDEVTVGVEDRQGRQTTLLSKPGSYTWPRLSPGGKRLALSVTEGGVTSVSIYDLATGKLAQLTPPTTQYLPIWTRDGKFLILGGIGGLGWIRSDGSGKTEPLTHSSGAQVPWSLSPDRSRLAYHAFSPATGFDLWTIPIHVSDSGLTAGTPEPFLKTPALKLIPRSLRTASGSPTARMNLAAGKCMCAHSLIVGPKPRFQKAVDGFHCGSQTAMNCSTEQTTNGS